MLKNYILICLIILISGCKTKKEEIISMKTITVALEQRTFQIPFSELFNNVEVIPLETSDYCLIGHINKIILKNNNLYIHDDIAKCVFIFDKQGNFLTKIGTVGRGPGEYIDLKNIYIDDKENYLVFDCFNKYMLFDLLSNEFILEKKYLLSGYEQRIYLGNEMFATYCDNFIDENKENNLVIEQKGNIMRAYFPIDKDLQGYTYRNENVFTENFEGKKYFTCPYKDTIFTLNKGVAKPYVYIDYGKNKLPEHYFQHISNDQKTTQLLRSSYCHSTDNFIDNENYTYFRFCAEGRSILNYLLLKREQKSYLFSDIKADSNGYCPVLINNVFDAGDSFIAASEIGQLKDFLSQINTTENVDTSQANMQNEITRSDAYKQIKQFSENEDNNPILFVLHLR